MAILHDLKKYIDYILDAESFKPRGSAADPSSTALGVPPSLGGSARKPALIIHGIMPRSGTVYVGQLLRLHPDLHGLPRNLWELPLLQLSDDILNLQLKFLRIYEQNADKMGSADFLEIVGGGMLAYLQAATAIRGVDRQPAIMIHGIMPRTGCTVDRPWPSRQGGPCLYRPSAPRLPCDGRAVR